eukprot:3196195-Prymnesium_polylepis.2
MPQRRPGARWLQPAGWRVWRGVAVGGPQRDFRLRLRLRLNSTPTAPPTATRPHTSRALWPKSRESETLGP